MFQQDHLKVYGIIWMIAIAGFAWLLLLPELPVNTCIFKQATGLPCPSCGSSRSVQALLHGHWLQIFSYNPLGIITFFMVLVGAIWSVADVFRGSQSLYVSIKKWLAFIKRPLAAWGLILIILANWLWNIAKHL
jgi:hypothetical protein